MQLYDGKIRLGGSVLNEVRKTNMTAAEVEVLRNIHGSDAVVDLRATRMDKRSHLDERKRLADTYAGGEDNNAETLKKKQQLLRDLFGHESTPLPMKLAEDIPDAEPVDKPKRTRIETQVAEQRAVLE